MLILSLLMFFVVTAGSGLAALQLSQTKDVWLSANSLQAYYLAEAGIQDAIADWTNVKTMPYSTHNPKSLSTIEGTMFGSYDYRCWGGNSIISVGSLTSGAATCTLKANVDVASGSVTGWDQLASPPP